MKSSRLERMGLFVAFLWPFIFYSNLLIPWIDGTYWQLGNDFHPLYYDYKVYFLSSLASGHFPLWSPAEAAGYPFYSSPFAQAFYPLNVFLLGFYKVFNGYPALIHQWFTVLGVGIFCVGTYLWLRSLTGNATTALASAMVFSVCLKMGDMLRFPNAVHTAAWLPWILFFMHRLPCADSRRRDVLALFLALLCFLTGGYPYYVYYSLFLFIPYAVVILVPRTRLWLFLPERTMQIRSALLSVIGAAAAALVTASPYLYKMYQLLTSTTDRAGHNFEFSTGISFDAMDTLGSLIYPPAAQTEGIYFFGVAALMFIAFEIIRRPRPAHLLLLSWFGTITYITWGKRSLLFKMLWHVLPGFSHLRVWGRMNILLVLILAWLFAVCLNSFSREATDGRVPRLKFNKVVIFSSMGLMLLAIQLWLHLNQIRDEYWTSYIKPIVPFWFAEAHSLLFGWISFGVLLVSLGLAPSLIRRPAARTVIVVVLALSILDMSVVGRKQWASKEQFDFLELAQLLKNASFRSATAAPQAPPPTAQPIFKESRDIGEPDHGKAGTSLKVDNAPNSINLESFRVARYDGYTTISVTSAFSVGTIQNWYFGRYLDFRAKASAEPEARDRFLGTRDGTKLYCSDSISYSRITDFLEDSSRCRGSIKILAYNGDMLSMDIRLDRTRFLSFIDNWDSDWRAYLDGVEVPIELLFGTFKSVRTPEGQHRLDFRYSPLH